MPPRSPSPPRGRASTRSVYSDRGRSPSRSVSRPRRSVSPRVASRSPRRQSRYKSESRDRSRSYSHGRSPSPPRSTKIVVEKLTKNITADHLREIFGTYGTIRDLDMPMNRQFDFNRGTAYILYSAEVDAEAAIAHMHESQIDGAVINVSIVLPRRKFSPSPPLARKSANIDARPPPSSSYRGPPARHQVPCHVLDRHADIERGHDLSLLGPRVHPEDVEDDEPALGETGVDDKEVLATAVTVVMMIEVVAAVVIKGAIGGASNRWHSR
ncbi:hypothetical protein K3495_g11674 [Podosphaera aphanis]|nr:hypothetical protein K3495_g11674 [Podosphaera aphanis]